MPVIARVTLESHYSSEALAELGKKFPNKDRLSSEKYMKVRYLTFIIEDEQCTAFVEAHRGLGRHRGELTFFRPLTIPQTISP